MKAIIAALVGALTFATVSTVHAQGRVVTGTVISKTDSQPVPGVVLRIKGSTATERTGPDGRFRIEMPVQALDILVIRHPEYDAVEVELLGRTEVEFVLTPRVRYDQYGVAVPRVPLGVEERDGILVFESPDQEYRLWFDYRFQADAAVFSSHTLNPIGNGVEIRRARMAVKSQLTRAWYAELDMDFADSRVEVKDAYLMYTTYARGTETMRERFLEVRMGNFKETFSLETNTTSRYLVFMERPMATKVLTPSRHLGVQAKYTQPYLMTAVGVHFQDVGDPDLVQSRKDNNSSAGQNEGYSLTGKVVLMPFFRDVSRGLHLGVAGSYRTPKLDDRVGTVRFDTRGPANINRKKYLDTDRITDVRHTDLRGFEAAGYLNGWRVQGEYNTAAVHRHGGLPTEHFNGGYLTASALLFGGRYRYNVRDAEFTQPFLVRHWGDVELGGRYEYLDLDSRTDGVMMGAGEAWTVGLNWYPSNNVKFQLNHSWLNHDRWAGARRSLYVGHAEDGSLTRDPTLVVDPKGKSGEDYRVLAARVQVSF